MKTLFNLSTSPDDLLRFENQEELLSLLTGFDGLELMHLGPDERGIVPRERVTGLHLNCPAAWLDFWRGNERALLEEFGSCELWQSYYGGNNRKALVEFYRRQLDTARAYGAEYVVFHVSDTLTADFFTQNYRHGDAEVIDAACEVLNAVFAKEDGSIALLMENLWHPGLRFTVPELTARLLDGVCYPNKGIMLDTGHLMHTETKLGTQEEALAYIHRRLDEHGALCRYIRGVHLHQSITGDYMEHVRQAPPAMADTWQQRQMQAYYHAFAVDKHEPFTCPGVKELLERISPQWLTFEFITESLLQHKNFLNIQRLALGMND